MGILQFLPFGYKQCVNGTQMETFKRVLGSCGNKAVARRNKEDLIITILGLPFAIR